MNSKPSHQQLALDAFWLQAAAVAKIQRTNHRPAGAGRHATMGLAGSAWLALALGDFAPGIFSDWGAASLPGHFSLPRNIFLDWSLRETPQKDHGRGGHARVLQQVLRNRLELEFAAGTHTDHMYSAPHPHALRLTPCENMRAIRLCTRASERWGTPGSDTQVAAASRVYRFFSLAEIFVPALLVRVPSQQALLKVQRLRRIQGSLHEAVPVAVARPSSWIIGRSVTSTWMASICWARTVQLRPRSPSPLAIVTLRSLGS
ncbi:hypothetical protein CCMA1212_007925 [Trichoderma ghanense]|uniref:Uncharacterized protein n=1 Tax=Trichoderma ghanense TaxID=65468 RepID=A0ABY2GX26_9HYPO